MKLSVSSQLFLTYKTTNLVWFKLMVSVPSGVGEKALYFCIQFNFSLNLVFTMQLTIDVLQKDLISRDFHGVASISLDLNVRP